MLLQMVGFLFALMGVGGLLCVLAIADPQHKSASPRLGFALFFAGLLAFCLSVSLALFFEFAGLSGLSGVGFLAGYVLGGTGGALLGFARGSRTRAALNQRKAAEQRRARVRNEAGY